MFIKYEPNCCKYLCSVCKYTYVEDYNETNNNSVDNKPFIKTAAPITFDINTPTRGTVTQTKSVYICPLCGTLQIDVSSI